MTRKAKKLLATLLAASMVMSMVSMTAFAKEPGGEDSGTNSTVVGENQSEPKIEDAYQEGSSEPLPDPEQDVEPDDSKVMSLSANPDEGANQEDAKDDPAPSTKDEWESWIKGQMGDNKFIAVLASKLDEKTVDAVIGTVDKDYNAKLVLPNSASGNSAVIGVGMQDVGSLGVSDVRIHAMILRDQAGQGTVMEGEALSGLMKDLYGFRGATVNATIIGTDGVKYPVTYKISGVEEVDGKTTITAKSSEDASAAWHAMVNDTNFTVSGTNPDNSSITIANGSWMQIGNQLLKFEDGKTEDLKLDNITDFASLNTEIRKAVELVKQNGTSVSFHLEAGTELAVSSSSAALNVPVTVNMTGVELDGKVLEDLRDGSSNSITALFGMMNTVLAQASGNDNINVTMKFGDTAEEPESTEEQVHDIIADLLKDNKFVAIVASKLTDNSIAQLVGTVNADYVATLRLPVKANAGNVTIGVGMNNVASMGINSPKIHTKYLETGLTVEADVADFVGTLYNFESTTINAVITKGDKQANVTYKVSEAKDNVITATPSVENGTINDAWKLLVKDNFEFVTKEDDSYIVIAKGSWLKIGKDLLVFEENGPETLKLDNITMENLGTLNETIRAAVKLIEAQEDQKAPVMFHLAKGTELAVSSSSAKLTEDVTVSVDGVSLSEGGVDNILSNLRDAQSADAKNAILAMMNLMNGMLEAVQDKTVNVTIEFTCKHEYSEDQPAWAWAEDHTSATATFTCEKCGHEETETATGEAITNEVTTPAQVGVAGERTYTATVTFNDREYTNAVTEAIPALPSSSGSSGGGTRRPTVNIEDENPPLVDKPFLFVDVTENDWFYDAVKYVYNKGLMDGVEATLFDAKGDTTRGAVAQVLYNMVGRPAVEGEAASDVKATDWYHDASIWAFANGVYAGYEDGTFRGDQAISREELVAVLYRFAGLQGWDVSETSDLESFIDAELVGQWARGGMQWAVGAGMIVGRADNDLDPQGGAIRVELAAVLARFVEKYNPTLTV